MKTLVFPPKSLTEVIRIDFDFSPLPPGLLPAGPISITVQPMRPADAALPQLSEPTPIGESGAWILVSGGQEGTYLLIATLRLADGQCWDIPVLLPVRGHPL